MRVLFFGDSITQGFWDTEGGWVQRIRKVYDERRIKGIENDPPTVFNLGISGDVTEGILKRLDNEVEAHKWRWPDEELTFVFAIGINDSIIENGVERSNPEKYREELEKLISKAKHYSDKLLFVELTPCDEVEVNNRPGKAKQYTVSRVQQFNETLRSVCAKYGVPIVKVWEEMKKRLDKGENLLTDGLHPNDAGHQLIADLVKPELDKLLAGRR